MKLMKQRIAVLGAGPMGLAVAYQLARDGHEPIIFEADDRVGGMTASFDFSGLQIERYYHFHCISDHAFLAVLDELEIADKMRWIETKMSFWYQGRLQSWGNPLALLKFQGLSFLAKLRYGLHAFLSTKRKNWRSLDGLNAVSWLRRSVGEEAYDILWRPLLEYKFYHHAEHLSAAWIWSRIRRIGRSRYNIFREKLGYLEGGSSTLLQALEKDILKHGGQIHLSSPVEEVVIEQEKVIGIKIAGKIHHFDKVISSIPIPYVSRLMPNLPENILQQFKTLQNIAVVCVIVKLKQAVTKNFWLNINDPEMDIPGIVEYTNLRSLDHHLVYVPFYMPGEHPKFSEPDQVFLNKVRSYLQKINPNLTNEDFIDIKANRYRYAQPICSPNHLANLPPVSLPVKGLWVADTSYYYPEDRGISESIDFGRQLAREAAVGNV
jgi:protoporphyrinogen oxidase